MAYLLKMVISHGKLLNNQMVFPEFLTEILIIWQWNSHHFFRG